MGVGLAQGWGGFHKAAPDVDAAHLAGDATTWKCRIARQHLDAEALTAD
jgi:hypothetical protein